MGAEGLGAGAVKAVGVSALDTPTAFSDYDNLPCFREQQEACSPLFPPEKAA